MIHALPELKFRFEDLEPYIDTQTMELHYTKHHQSYVDNLNKVVSTEKSLVNIPAEELLRNISKIPISVRTLVKNNAGGHVNHSFFWKILKKDKDTRSFINIILNDFGSMDRFRSVFKENALRLFGSGWTWVVINSDRRLEVLNTYNQDSPITDNKHPVLCIDLWEHSYYLKYRNNRSQYIDSFFNVIDWDQVMNNYQDFQSL